MNVQLSKILIPICNAIHFLNCLPLIRYLRILIQYLIEFIGRTVCISLLRSIHDHCNHRGRTTVLLCTKRGLIVFIGPCQPDRFLLSLDMLLLQSWEKPRHPNPQKNSKGPKCTFLRTKFQIVHKKKKIEFHFLLFGVVYSKRGNSLVGSKRSVPKNITSLKRRLKMTQEMILNRELECRVTHIKHTFIPTRMSGTRIKIGYKICHEVPKSP